MSQKKPYLADIEASTLDNDDFRKVVFTGEHEQLVYMSLKPHEDIGEETHDIDQFFRFEAGSGIVVLNGKEHTVKDGFGVVIPAGTRHNVINSSDSEPLKLYTIYSAKQHPQGAVFATKEDSKKEHEVMKSNKNEDVPTAATADSFDICPLCFGKGYINLHSPCSACGGNGIVPSKK